VKVGSSDVYGEIKDLLPDNSFDNLVVDLLDEISFLLSKKERRRWRCGFGPFIISHLFILE
jgi:hypothetical protein